MSTKKNTLLKNWLISAVLGLAVIGTFLLATLFPMTRLKAVDDILADGVYFVAGKTDTRQITSVGDGGNTYIVTMLPQRITIVQMKKVAKHTPSVMTTLHIPTIRISFQKATPTWLVKK